jgi:hypothetical protein
MCKEEVCFFSSVRRRLYKMQKALVVAVLWDPSWNTMIVPLDSYAVVEYRRD